MKKFIPSLQLIILGVILSVGLSYAAIQSPIWNPGAPLVDNVDVPINAGTGLQEKKEGLSVNTFAALGDAQLMQQAFFRGPVKGIDVGSSNPTLEIGGVSTTGMPKRVVTTVNGNLDSGATIGSTELKNTTLTRLCADTSGHVVLCPSGSGSGGTGGGGSSTYASCFIADTMVTLANGTQKAIQDVQIGDVLKGDVTNNTVLAFHQPLLGNDKLYSFNGGEYFVTAEHPFLTTKGWKSIDPSKTKKENIGITVTPLHIGDTLVTDKGLVKLTTIDSKNAAKTTQLYNFILDGDHTYYADGYLVHNKNACTLDGGNYPQCGAPLTCLNSATSQPLTGTGNGVCSLSCTPNQPVASNPGACPSGKSLQCSATGEQICN